MSDDRGSYYQDYKGNVAKMSAGCPLWILVMNSLNTFSAINLNPLPAHRYALNIFVFNLLFSFFNK